MTPTRLKSRARSARLCSVVSLALIATLGFARAARASSDYPPALQAALEKELGGTFCTPLCTACHNTTQGGPENINVFGRTLEEKYGLLPGNPALVDIAIQGLKSSYDAGNPDDSDGDGAFDVDELKKGDSPSLPGAAGTDQFCPDIAYGCGARIATRPPADRISLFGFGVLGFGLIALRRKRSRAFRLLTKRTSF